MSADNYLSVEARIFQSQAAEAASNLKRQDKTCELNKDIKQ